MIIQNVKRTKSRYLYFPLYIFPSIRQSGYKGKNNSVLPETGSFSISSEVLGTFVNATLACTLQLFSTFNTFPFAPIF